MRLDTLDLVGEEDAGRLDKYLQARQKLTGEGGNKISKGQFNRFRLNAPAWPARSWEGRTGEVPLEER